MILSCTHTPESRVIPFEGIENARDMGGLVMEDGRKVQGGKLIRSGNLSRATDADVDLLTGKYQLSDVFDFRFDAEAAADPDHIIEGVTYTRLSTLPQAFIDGFSQGRADSSQVSSKDFAAALVNYAALPQAQELVKKLYPAIVSDRLSQRYYGDFLRGVLASGGASLWHCSQGKDRAGWASAFVLVALGASREVIVADFDLSNESYAPYVEALSAKVRENGGGEAEVSFIRAMVGVSRENFEAALDLIDRRYGGLRQYITAQLGFSEEEQNALKDKYLK